MIPIYRAKKIDSDEFVEGLLCRGYELRSGNEKPYIQDHTHREWQINPLTLAIHFPDMIDLEGTKIFASLSEDGKGGDIIHGQEYSSTGNMASNIFRDFTTLYKTKNIVFTAILIGLIVILPGIFYIVGLYFDYNYFTNLKVVGIQE